MPQDPDSPEPRVGSLGKPDIDLDRLRAYRLERLRAEMRRAGVPLAVLTNPVSLRYAVDFREYMLFQSRIPTFTLFVAAEGPAVLFGASNKPNGLVDEVRPSHLMNSFDSGLDLGDRARLFAGEVKGFLGDIGVKDSYPSVAIERSGALAIQALQQAGLQLVEADPLVERAKTIKSAEEIACLTYSIQVAEHGMALMHQALVQQGGAGITENQLWAILHQVNIAHDGEWMEGRMLASGPRTNPWLQEATDRVVQAGELVAFDTDMIGPFGYCADISRTWFCGPGEPSVRQRDCYAQAFEEVQHNKALIKPGLSFRELTEAAFRPRAEFIAHRYPCLAHGIGMSDEYPKICYRQDWDRAGYDGVIEADMVLCVESFTGSDQGGEGVKLEQVVRVTETGCEELSSYPFEETLL